MFTFYLPLSFSQSVSPPGYVITFTGHVGGKSAENTRLGYLIHYKEHSEWFVITSALKEKKDTTFLINDAGDTTNRIFGSYIPSKGRRIVAFKDFANERVIFDGNSSMHRDALPNVADTLYPMKWALIDEKKKIGEITCFKAETDFRGRHYTAWYAPSIGINNGPWKFGGLPGLITEVYDNENYLFFTLQSIMPTEKEAVEIPQGPYRNYEEYKRDFKKGAKRIIAAMSADEKVDPNCLTCGKVELKIDTIEKLLD